MNNTTATLKTRQISEALEAHDISYDTDREQDATGRAEHHWHLYLDDDSTLEASLYTKPDGTDSFVACVLDPRGSQDEGELHLESAPAATIAAALVDGFIRANAGLEWAL